MHELKQKYIKYNIPTSPKANINYALTDWPNEATRLFYVFYQRVKRG